MAALDATVVNVALPAIGRDFGASVSGLQWVVTGYLITLASLILLGGSLGDLFGRRRVFVVGVVWFGAASLLSAVAPDLQMLVAARALQGVGGALLTPGSLAIIEASFASDDRGRAIGAWSGLGGIAAAVGPLVGGWLVSAASWRLIFVLNLPLAAAVLVASRHVPESSDPAAHGDVDVIGAVLAVVGLAGLTYALIEGPAHPGSMAAPLLSGVAGVAGLVAFVVYERRTREPMLPLTLFASRQFSSANLVTFAVYAALTGMLFLLAVELQQALGYSPVEAGAALAPLTVIMLLFSARAGRLAERIGPRLPMTVGPAVVAAGLLLMARIHPGGTYLGDVLPAVVVFAAGLALTVAPLTTTVLAAAEERRAGVASAVNNAVARAAGLIAVAVLPPLAGITGAEYRHPADLSSGFHVACAVAGGLCLLGALIAWLGVQNPPAVPRPAAATGERERSCPVEGPPLRRVAR